MSAYSQEPEPLLAPFRLNDSLWAKQHSLKTYEFHSLQRHFPPLLIKQCRTIISCPVIFPLQSIELARVYPAHLDCPNLLVKIDSRKITAGAHSVLRLMVIKII